jgi:hypothetical protein
LDSTEKLLRELPLELSSHSNNTHSSNSCSKSPINTGGLLQQKDIDTDNLPSLKYYNPYSDKNESYPMAVLKRISERTLEFSSSSFSDSEGEEKFFEDAGR